MEVQLVSIDTPKPYESNPRNNEKAVAKVADSLRAFGWQQPVVVDEDMVVLAGHTRLLAAKSLGYTQVPIKVAAGLDDAQKVSYRIADNKTSEFATWDKELLAQEFQLLAELDADMSETGYDLDEIARINEELLAFEGMDEELEEEEIEIELDQEPQSHVKMVLLYLDQQSEPRFRDQCDKIMKANNLQNITDAVVLAVENECKNL